MEAISILWPGEAGNAGKAGKKLTDFSASVGDLELGDLAAMLYTCFPGTTTTQALEATSKLTTSDPEILRFRRDCIGDLLQHPELLDTLQACLSDIQELTVCGNGIRENADGLANNGGISGLKGTLDKLERLFGSHSNLIDENDLDNYCGQLFRATIFSYRLAKAYTELVTSLHDKLSGVEWSSAALRSLRDWIDQVYTEDTVAQSQKILKELSGGWNGVGSFTCDIIVDQMLNITGVELTGINSEPFARAGLTTARPDEPADGLSRLTEFPQGGATARFQECLVTELGTSMKSDLYHLRDAVTRLPVRAVRFLRQLGEEIPFYIACARFCLRLKESGCDICCPTESADYLIQAEGAYPISTVLLHQKAAAANDLVLPIGGNVSFITGANSSGKTTLLITAGQLQWLYQLGCWLPCRSAAMHAADGVYTLFASGESEEGNDSRMGMEVQKLASFRDQMTSESLILMNEPMTSTSAGEGIELCVELLHDLMRRHISGMMVTHYNEIWSLLHSRLAEAGDADPARFVSYVMEVDIEDGHVTYPYRLCQKNPGRSSHADEIIKQAGADLASMLKSMLQSGLDMRPDDACWSQLHKEQEV